MTASPGWYPDERDPDREWYWNGLQWSGSRRAGRSRGRIVLAVVLLVLGAILVIGGVSAVASALVSALARDGGPSDGVGGGVNLLIGVGLIVGGILLLRPESPAARAARHARREALEAAAQQRRNAEAAEARRAVDGWVERMAALGYCGVAVVAHRNAQYFAARAHGERAEEELAAALAAIDYDVARLDSPQIGRLRSIADGVELEVHRDYVIFGQQAEDVDERTVLKVYLDGQIQVTTGHVAFEGVGVPFHQQHDTRRAEVQVVSDRWAIRVPIAADDVNEARRISEQLARHVDRLALGLRDGDLRRLVDAILDAKGQSPAQKLKELSNLRFERLLSDEEFERAKERVLGGID